MVVVYDNRLYFVLLVHKLSYNILVRLNLPSMHPEKILIYQFDEIAENIGHIWQIEENIGHREYRATGSPVFGIYLSLIAFTQGEG